MELFDGFNYHNSEKEECKWQRCLKIGCLLLQGHVIIGPLLCGSLYHNQKQMITTRLGLPNTTRCLSK